MDEQKLNNSLPEKALKAFREAEAQLLAHDQGSAEKKLKELLNTFYSCTDQYNKVCIASLAQILRTLAEIHLRQGKKEEAQLELVEAARWEEKLKNINKQ